MAKDFAEIERMEAEAGLQATDGELTSEAKQSLTSRFVAQWEKKNARRAIRGGVVSTMALTLAACGDDDDDPDDSDPDTTPTAQTFTLTTSIDDGEDFTGGAGDDRFEQTEDGQLSIDDTLDGGEGDDELIVRDVQNDVSAFTATNIETIDVRTAANATIDIVNASGYDKLVVNASPNNVTFDNIALSEAATFVVQDQSTATTISFDYTDEDLAGSSDAATLELNAVTAATTLSIDDSDAASQLETLTIDSTADNTGVVTLSDDALTASTINITGSGDLDLTGAALATKGTIDASELEGDVAVKLGTVDHTFTGGSGKDIVLEDSGGDFDKNDTLSGGPGSADVIGVASAPGSDDFTNVSGFEILRATANGLTIDADNVGGISKYEVVTDNDVDGLTISNIASASVVDLKQTDKQDLGALVFNLKSNTASDSLTVNFTVTDDSGDDALTVTSLDSATSLDTLNISTAGFDGSKVTITTYDAGASNLVVTGDTNFKIGGLAGTGSADGELDSIDASKLTGTFEADFTGADGDLVIEGSSSKANTVTLSGHGDTFIGGSAVDTVTDAAGVDTLTFGDGADKFTVNHKATDVIKDFVGGSDGDVLTVSEQDLDGSGDVIAATTLTFVNLDDGATVDGSTPTAAKIQVVSGQETIGADVNVIALTETASNVGAAVDLLEAGESHQITVGENAADEDEAFLMFWSDGTDGYLSVVSADGETTANGVYESEDLVGNDLVKLEGIASIGEDTLTDANIAFA